MPSFFITNSKRMMIHISEPLLTSMLISDRYVFDRSSPSPLVLDILILTRDILTKFSCFYFEISHTALFLQICFTGKYVTQKYIDHLGLRLHTQNWPGLRVVLFQRAPFFGVFWGLVWSIHTYTFDHGTNLKKKRSVSLSIQLKIRHES